MGAVCTIGSSGRTLFKEAQFSGGGDRSRDVASVEREQTTSHSQRPHPQDVIEFFFAVKLSLEDNLFCKILRSPKRGAACGPKIYEHLRFLLIFRSAVVILKSWVNFSPGPRDAIRMGRVTALRKRPALTESEQAGFFDLLLHTRNFEPRPLPHDN